MIDESMRTNDSQPQFVLNRIYEIMEENGITDNEIVKNQVLDCFNICPKGRLVSLVSEPVELCRTIGEGVSYIEYGIQTFEISEG